MKRFRTVAAVGLATVVIAAAMSARAAQPDAEANDYVNPTATNALKGMGAYLRTLKVFQVEAATTDEDVLDDGQKIQYDGVTDLLVQAPNHMRAHVVNERHERLYLFDGKEFTLYAARLNSYVTVPAPATIRELAQKLHDEHDITIPLGDLFRWGDLGRRYRPDQGCDRRGAERRRRHDL